jgi:hypothetical protein
MWVTIMLGVLAVVGTVGGAWGGQWIAARRDDHRWAREIKREDLRWERQREVEGIKRDHEMRMHWSVQRLNAYTECLHAFEDWMDILNQERKQLRMAEGDEDVLGRRNRKVRETVKTAVDRVHVIGSVEAISGTIGAYRTFHWYRHRLHISDEPGWKPNEPQEIDAQFDMLADAVGVMRSGFRRDVGFESGDLSTDVDLASPW